MLHDFLATHRAELIQRCHAKLLLRPPHGGTLHNGVPLFIDQLILTLQTELALSPLRPPGTGQDRPEIGMAAALHGKEMLSHGYAVTDVVHNYGDICQAITDLAVESGTPFLAKEFRIVNRCLDNAIAHAVTEFTYQRDFVSADKHASDASLRMASFLDELRKLLGTATLAFAAAKSGGLSASGATGAILERSLQGISRLIDSVVQQAGTAGHISDVLDVFALAPLIGEVRDTATLAAQSLGCTLVVLPVDAALAVKGSRDSLYAALVSLLQNAFEFTRLQSEVTLSVRTASDRILVEIADHRGGLGQGGGAAMLAQSADDCRSMLGIPVARRFIVANDGALSVRDVPDVGCVMTVSLPRYAVPT